jgi:hypothetical protein
VVAIDYGAFAFNVFQDEPIPYSKLSARDRRAVAQWRELLVDWPAAAPVTHGR